MRAPPSEFFDWLEARGVDAARGRSRACMSPPISSSCSKARSAPTAKLRLAALRHLFDWLVIGQIMPVNPAAAVRGPRHIVRRGKTPVLDPAGGAAAHRRDRHHDRHRPARPRADRLDGLFLRAHRRGDRHARRGRVFAEPAAMGALAREGRQAARHAVPSQS